jgi:hypothetical protein
MQKSLTQLLRNQERPEEPFTPPEIDIDPAIRIAKILENNPGDLATQLGIQGVRGASQEELAKVIMIDNARSVLGKANYDIAKTLPQLCLEISRDVYAGMFDVMSEVYLREIRTVDPEHPYEEHPIGIVDYFKGPDVSGIVSAQKIAGYVEELGDRLAYVENPSELNYLVGVELYLGMIRDEEIRQDVIEKAQNPEYLLYDAFVYAAVSLQKDFIKLMEGLE